MSGGDDVVPTAAELLAQAWQAIAQAQVAQSPELRFERAAVAAVRAASAVLAAVPPRDGAPGRTTGEPRSAAARSVWTLVVRRAPELREWADFFGAATRACVRLRSHGIEHGGITQRLADDLLRDADRFTHEVRALLLRRRTRQVAAAVAR